jgi:hypothetical protein
MRSHYQARWVSKPRADILRRQGAILLDSFNGIIVIEPVGSNQGDGHILTADEVDYELQPVWCRAPKTRIEQARKLLFGEAVHSMAS